MRPSPVPSGAIEVILKDGDPLNTGLLDLSDDGAKIDDICSGAAGGFLFSLFL